MALKLASMSLSSSPPGGFDSRKASRASRARPWMTGSVLRGRSAAVGDQVSKDAPSLPLIATVSLDSSPAPSATVVRGSVKQSASRIPILVRRCGSPPLGKEDVPGKVESSATPSVDAEMAASSSRIPVRSKVSSAVYRPVPAQVRRSSPLVVHASLSSDKEAGVPNGSVVPFARPVPEPEETSIQRCINPKPIRSHRSDIRVKPILKHRVKSSDETDPHCPSLPAGQGVKSDPVARKSVHWPEVFVVHSEPRPWPGQKYVPVCCFCGASYGHLDSCRESAMKCGDQHSLSGIVEWLAEQMDRGHDYLKQSGGFLGVRGLGLDPTVPAFPEYAVGQTATDS